MSIKLNKVKQPYEISLWDFVIDKNNQLKERKIAIIGSDSMTAKSCAIDPVFTRNINGTKTITFKMYTQYFDELEQKVVDNPFVKLMVVERIVKLYYKNKWYDLVIKKRQESSDKKTYSFTASDLHINELSKNGFNLEFKTELRNNQGTVLDLAEQIVAGTLWLVDRENSDIIRAYVNEQLYSFSFGEEAICLDMLTGETITISAGNCAFIFYSSVKGEEVEKQIIYSEKYNTKDNLYNILTTDDGIILLDEDNSNKIHNLLFFGELNEINDLTIASYRGKKLVKKPITKYNSVLDRYVNVFQDNKLDYVEGYTKTEYLSPTFVENFIINGEKIKSTDGWNLAFQEEQDKTSTCEVYSYPDPKETLLNGSGTTVQLDYRNYLKFNLYNLDSYDNIGFISNYKKIGRIQKGDKFCILYRFKLKEQLGTDDYLKTNIIKFQFYNDSNAELPDKLATFSSIEKKLFNGQNYCKVTATFNYDLSEEDVRHLHFLLYRNPSNITSEQYKNYFETEFYLEELQVFREIYCDKYYTGKINNNFFLNGKASSVQEITEEIEEKNPDAAITIINFTEKVKENLEKIENFTTGDEYYYDENNHLIIKNAQLLPGEVPVSGAIETKFFYSPTANLSITKEEDYKYLDNNENLYVQLYNDKDYPDLFGETYRRYEKITSIEQAESNRFNLIQGLCEKFQCWADFIVEHDSKGFITNRKICFKEYIGSRKYSGFKYGINLKSIQRDIDSTQIVTKTIVKPNNNKFGKNGFCTIARAEDNFLRQNYLLDFSYYINQGLISEDVLCNDLYVNFENFTKLDGKTKAGYYELMLERGIKRNQLSERLVSLLSNELKVKSQITVLDEGIAEAKKLYIKALAKYKDFLKVDYPNIPYDEPIEGETAAEKEAREAQNKKTEIAIRRHSRFKTICTEIENLAKEIVNLETERASYGDYTENFFIEERKKINEQIEALQIEKIQQTFFNKYSLFLHEGTWTSENYYDDNLYYIDALDVSRTSAKPKISYTINVIDVSPIEGFEPYEIDIGDKTYIEDTEFFGWVRSKNGIKTPYKEEVVVIEIAEHLDNLNANQIKVQNYKTQFDDLFQRIAASTQSLTYASGGYQKAANVVASGQVDPNYFQNTLENNSIDIKNGANGNVEWTSEGITIHNGIEKNRFVRLTGEGIKISIDGGQSWGTAITGEGINTDYLNAGTIDASKINIITNGSQTFSWNENGITAFAWEEGQSRAEAETSFVRLDQFGVYHIKDDDSNQSFVADSIDSIKEMAETGKSNFALLRDGSLHLGRYELTENGLGSDAFELENLDSDAEEFSTMYIGRAPDLESPEEIQEKIDQKQIEFDEETDWMKKMSLLIQLFSLKIKYNAAIQKKAQLSTVENSISFYKNKTIEKEGKKEITSKELRTYISAEGIETSNLKVLNLALDVLTLDEGRILLKNSGEIKIGEIYSILSSNSSIGTYGSTYLSGCISEIEEKRNGWIIVQGVNTSSDSVNDARVYLRPTTTHSDIGIRMMYQKDNNKRGDLYGDWYINNAMYFGSSRLGSDGNLYFGSSRLDSNGNLYFGYKNTETGNIITDIAGSGENLRGRVYITGCSTELSPNAGKYGILVLQGVDSDSDNTKEAYLCMRPTNKHDDLGIVMHYKRSETESLKSGILYGDWTCDYLTTKYLTSKDSYFYFRNTNKDDVGHIRVIHHNDTGGTITYLVGSSGDYTDKGALAIRSINKTIDVSKTTSTGDARVYISPTSDFSILGIAMYYNKSDLYGKLNGTWYISDVNGTCNLNGTVYVKNKLYFGNTYLDSNGSMNRVLTNTVSGLKEGEPYVLYLQGRNITRANMAVDDKSYVFIRSNQGDNKGAYLSIKYQKPASGQTATDRGDLYGNWYIQGTSTPVTSDLNKKNTINYLSNNYSDLFDNLIPVTYKYNDGTSNRLHTGFIAQDVEEALQKSNISTSDFAGLVIANEEDEETKEIKQVYYLRYEEFIALNTNEIQKLKRRVAILEEEIAQLKRNFYS